MSLPTLTGMLLSAHENGSEAWSTTRHLPRTKCMTTNPLPEGHPFTGPLSIRAQLVFTVDTITVVHFGANPVRATMRAFKFGPATFAPRAEAASTAAPRATAQIEGSALWETPAPRSSSSTHTKATPIAALEAVPGAFINMGIEMRPAAPATAPLGTLSPGGRAAKHQKTTDESVPKLATAVLLCPRRAQEVATLGGDRGMDDEQQLGLVRTVRFWSVARPGLSPPLPLRQLGEPNQERGPSRGAGSRGRWSKTSSLIAALGCGVRPNEKRRQPVWPRGAALRGGPAQLAAEASVARLAGATRPGFAVCSAESKT
jgi:hypothetical protein